MVERLTRLDASFLYLRRRAPRCTWPAYGGTVNEVLLTVVTGALREWLLSRRRPVVTGTSVRALVPVSLEDDAVVVTTVPGPQVPLYAAGGRVLEVFPVVPLVRGQGLSVGMTSYDGRIFVGLNADAESVADVDLLADLVEQELGELLADTG